MTQEKPAKQPAAARVILGGGLAAVGGFMGFVGIAGFCAALSLGTGGLAAAVMAVAHLGAAAAGLWCLVRGTIIMGKGFSDAGKTPAEIRFEENPQTFSLQHLTRDFDLEARRNVKIMRPLKLSPKNTPQP